MRCSWRLAGEFSDASSRNTQEVLIVSSAAPDGAHCLPRRTTKIQLFGSHTCWQARSKDQRPRLLLGGLNDAFGLFHALLIVLDFVQLQSSLINHSHPPGLLLRSDVQAVGCASSKFSSSHQPLRLPSSHSRDPACVAD